MIEVMHMPEMPDEFLTALSRNKEAMQRFSGLPDPEKDTVLNRVRGARTQGEMDDIVNKL